SSRLTAPRTRCSLELSHLASFGTETVQRFSLPPAIAIRKNRAISPLHPPAGKLYSGIFCQIKKLFVNCKWRLCGLYSVWYSKIHPLEKLI
ncbi:MAG: hypothetical protein IJW08_09980, partial [Lentisphaeria bacterium]|nr:hypothetical protein [Lentisphaeria bacterium]